MVEGSGKIEQLLPGSEPLHAAVIQQAVHDGVCAQRGARMGAGLGSAADRAGDVA